MQNKLCSIRFQDSKDRFLSVIDKEAHLVLTTGVLKNFTESETKNAGHLMLCNLHGSFQDHLNTISFVLSRPYVFLNELNNFGQTPLTAACEHDWLEMVDCLLKCDGIDVNICNQNGHSPLAIASRKGNLDIVDNLLLRFDNINLVADYYSSESPLTIAFNNGYLDIAEVLLLKCKSNDMKVCDASGTSPLNCKSIHHSEKLLQMIVTAQHKYGQTPMTAACERRSLLMVSLLLEHANIDINEFNRDSETPLTIACKMGYSDIVEMLLLKCENIDVNKCNGKCQSPLVIASIKGHVNIVKYLMEYKQ